MELSGLRCKYGDCLHREEEAGCKAPEGVESGEIDGLRLESYRKLLEEIS
jgi:putative ribosome biogenesis GTPase RsgA